MVYLASPRCPRSIKTMGNGRDKDCPLAVFDDEARWRGKGARAARDREHRAMTPAIEKDPLDLTYVEGITAI